MAGARVQTRSPCPWDRHVTFGKANGVRRRGPAYSSSSSNNLAASTAGPRLAASASTRTTRTRPCTGTVSTSPDRSLACGLSVGWRLIRTRPCAHQSGAIGPCPHEARAPQPLVQALPVAVFGLRDPVQRFNAASAANGPRACTRAGGATTTGRRRRSGASIAGAGGPYFSGASPRSRQHPEAQAAQHRRHQVRLDRQPRGQVPAAPPSAPRRGSGNPVRRPPARPRPAAAAPARLRPSPCAAANPARPVAAAAGTETSPGAGSAGTGNAVLQRPQLRPHRRRPRLQQRRHEQREPARPHARAPCAARRRRSARQATPRPSPGITPSASVSRCSGPRTAGIGAAPRPAANSGARSRADPVIHVALQPHPQPLALRAVEELAVQHPHPRAQRADRRGPGGPPARRPR